MFYNIKECGVNKNENECENGGVVEKKKKEKRKK